MNTAFKTQVAKPTLSISEIPHDEIKSSLFLRTAIADVNQQDDLNQLIAKFKTSIQQVEEFNDDAEQVFEQVCIADGHVVADKSSAQLVEQAIKDARDEKSKEFSFQRVSVTDVVDVHIALLPLDEVRAKLQEEVQSAITQLVSNLIDQIEEGMLCRAIGSIEWLREDICQYSWLRIVSDVRKVKEWSIKSEYTQTQLVGINSIAEHRVKTETRKARHNQSVYYEWHTHDVTEAKDTSIRIYDGECPGWIDQMIKVLSKNCFGDWMTVAHGTLIRDDIQRSLAWEKTHERDLWIDTVVQTAIRTGNLMSPAVCFGKAVLSGWSDADLEE